MFGGFISSLLLSALSVCELSETDSCLVVFDVKLKVIFLKKRLKCADVGGVDVRGEEV